MTQIKKNSEPTGLEIAVIGMSGRFPGARDLDEFWEKLKNGMECITFFSDEELEKVGIPPEQLEDPNYIKAKGILDDIEHFDAPFFDYSPSEVKLMNPQLRMFHEEAWKALENAGYCPDTYDGLIGLYAGSSSSFLWEGFSLLSGAGGDIDGFSASHLKDKDYLSTRISYKLNLKGPSFTLQTACSTSLVAIHLACRALLTGECNMALAGGVTVNLPHISGYTYQEGMINSPDGHCRSFDADARGTLAGEGLGIVVLKSLPDALADGDTIHAVIKSSALNNDGVRKVGYQAPSVEGQADVIKMAQRMGQVEPESISYIEAHGTGTALGDPVEVEALKLAFDTGKKGFCGLGSVKSNLGHPDAAAGAAGFIKTVLALKHRMIPPSLFYKKPNPRVDFENSPFYVNDQLKEWRNDEYPLRAGVSSFGIGGTNAHVVVEEAPEPVQSSGSRPWQLLLLSAKTKTALANACQNLAVHLEENPGLNLPDAAYTLQVGRKAFKYRKMLLCSSGSEAVETLSAADPGKFQAFPVKEENRPMVFMFSGQGSQYVNMGLELYQTEPGFKKEIDHCFDVLTPVMGYDIKNILYPGRGENLEAAAEKINQFIYTSPIKFIFEYSLAKLIMKWGIKPHAMIGHSFGEYAAACLAGVFSLKDALTLVALRGRLMHELPVGAMLSVPLSEEELNTLLPEELSLAAVNGPAQCIVSGPVEATAALEEQLTQKGYECVRLRVPRAGHSHMMEPVLRTFQEKAAQLTLNKPQMPYISGLTGEWVKTEQAIDPGYWAKHLRSTIRFYNGLTELLKEKNAIFVQVGSDRSLSNFVHLHPDTGAGNLVLNLVRHPRDEISDSRFLLDKLGQLWLNGMQPDWQAFYSEETRQRVPLPGYPFEGQRYPIEADPFRAAAEMLPGRSPARKADMADWFYVPAWERSVLPPLKEAQPPGSQWLVFTDQSGLGKELTKRLEKEGIEAITVNPGSGFARQDDHTYTLDPTSEQDYDTLVTELQAQDSVPRRILHLWSITGGSSPGHNNGRLDVQRVKEAQDMGFYSLVNLTRAIGKLDAAIPFKIDVISDNLYEVTGEEALRPEKSTLLGPCRVIAREYTNIHCFHTDVVLPPQETPEFQRLVHQLVNELTSLSPDRAPAAAYRGTHRWTQTFKPLRLEKNEQEAQEIPGLREKGVYLVTGGLGGIGLVLARHLAETVQARLMLTGRSTFPPPEEWPELVKALDETDDRLPRLRQLLELRELGAEVAFASADVTDPDQVRDVVRRARETFGPVNGVIHAAGLPGGGMIQRNPRHMSEQVLAPKVYGTMVLDRVLKEEEMKPDFVMLCSSSNSFFPIFGQLDYCAANNFLDAFAHYKNSNGGPYTLSVNWDRWKNVGMAVAVEEQHKKLTGETPAGGMTAGQGAAVFDRLLAVSHPQVAVSNVDLRMMLEQLHSPPAEEEEDMVPGLEEDALSMPVHQRPELSTPYQAPEDDTQEQLADIWQRVFGISEVGINDDFFELGGDSLKAMIIAQKVRKEMAAEIPTAEFFARQTVANIAEYIEGAGEEKNAVIGSVEKKEYYALSSAQKRLYVLQQLEENSRFYNIPQVALLDAGVDIKRIEHTFKRLIERHESLRTSFHMIGDQPVQRVHDQVDFEIEYKEVDGPHASEVGTIIQDFVRPFDLSRCPLLGVGLIKKQGPKCILMLDMHHTITDGMSMGILLKELMILYSGASLPGLRIQYKDFSQWQNELLRSEEIQEQEAYWLGKFAGEIPKLDLPFDYPRPMMQSFEGDNLQYVFSKEEALQLKAMAVKQGATLYMVLLAVFNVLLMKLSGSEDIVIGSPVVGRKHADLQHVIGMFVNTLALRNYPAGGKRFDTFAAEVKENVLQAFENQDYQFENLVEKVGVHRDTSRNPLFDVMFSFQKEEDGMTSLEPDDQGASEYEYKNRIAKFDITCNAGEIGDDLAISFEYCTKLFKKETIETFAGYLREITAVVLEEPGCRISEIEMMPETEKKRLLFDFNNTSTLYPKDKTIPGLFEEQVEHSPDNIALVDAALSITYGQLNRKANQLAGVLRARGVKPDTIVALAVERSLEMMTAIIAILKAGGAYLPIDPAYPEERIQYILNDSNAGILLESETNPNDQNEENLCIVSNFECGTSDLNSSNLAYIIYTSGSTGRPKGVMVSHGSAVNLLFTLQAKYPFEETDAYLLKTSYLFDVSVTELFGWFMGGGRLAVLEAGKENDPDHILETVVKERITHINFVPSMFRVFLNLLEQDGSMKLAGLKYLFLAGEALVPELVARFRELNTGVRLENLYGPTEAAVYASYYSLSAWAGEGSILIGKPLDNMGLHILDRYEGLVPVGIPGELCIGGAGLARGYLNRPELTKQKFCGGPGGGFSKEPPGRRRLYRTGDLARWLDDGNIEFLGRIDHQVKIRGFRVELGEIESELLKVPGIEAAVAATGEANPGDTYICAYIVSTDEIDVPRLREELGKNLPEYMIPSYFMQVDGIPLTTSGKVDRKALPALEIKAGKGYVPPRDSIEHQLAATWSEVLKVEKKHIGIDANFFQLGGHSLTATSLAAKIQNNLNVKVSLGEIFKSPTIRQLADYIKTTGKSAAAVTDDHLVLLKNDVDNVNNLFLLHDGGGNVEGYMDFCNRLRLKFNCWGIRPNGLVDYTPKNLSIEELARQYIKTIKKVQPRGPYYIAGWSMGGTAAFEIAAQLELLNDEVKFLALIDAAPPSRDLSKNETPITLESELNWIRDYFQGIEIKEKLKDVTEFHQLWPLIVNHLETGGFDVESIKNVIPKEILDIIPGYDQIGIRELVDGVNLVRTLNNARAFYIPSGKIHTTLHYFGAAESTGIRKEHWNDYCSQPMKVYKVAGDHYSIFKAPDVVPLAALFADVVNNEKKRNQISSEVNL
jgi:amino acid adenylation domain-containing protein